MATPAVRALRRHFTRARLVGVMKPYVAAVVEGSGWFDELVPVGGLAATAWRLRRRRPELAVLLPNSFRAALTGKSTSTGIFDVLTALGKDESLARLRDQAGKAVAA